MDDVSKLQKINDLARELMKHGQASSMEEATRMATQQIESGTMPEAPSPSPEAAPQAAPAQPLPEVPEQAPAEEGVEPLQAVEKLVTQQQSAVSRMTTAVNAHTQQLNEMNNKINALIAEMTTLKDEVKRLRESPVTSPLPKKEAAQGQTQFKQEAQPAPAPAPEKKPDASGHARSGNYNPDDVSIEKFFYYGK